MSTPRIPPVPPNKGGELDKTAPSSEHRKVEKVEKISKIAEVDDESRAKQFRQFVDGTNQEEEESDLPTPFSLPSLSGRGPMTRTSLSSSENGVSFQDPGLSEAAETAVPSPGYSPPPSTYLGGTAAQDENEESPLPQSQQFWGGVEENQSQASPQMEENPRSSSRVFLSKEEENRKGTISSSDQDQGVSLEGKTSGKIGRKGAGPLERESTKKTESLFGPPGKPTFSAPEDSSLSRKKESPFSPQRETGEESSSFVREEKKKRAVGPEGVIAPKRADGTKYIGPLAVDVPGRIETTGQPPEERIGSQLGRALREEEKRPAASAKRTSEIREKWKTPESGQAISDQSIAQEQEWGGQDKKRSQKEKAETMQIESPTTTPLPDFCLPLANAAGAAAKPYLGPEALSIYVHMIGTITAMVSPKGDSRTEFVLNAPSFAHSKFYGATISIERFATAPYQLNILLTGSNEAVNAFNQNIPNLLSAFQSGNFSFTINRIESAYARPLFHRKESGKEKDEKGRGFGGGDMDNRKK